MSQPNMSYCMCEDFMSLSEALVEQAEDQDHDSLHCMEYDEGE